jgi:hypothetical protein
VAWKDGAVLQKDADVGRNAVFLPQKDAVLAWKDRVVS